MSRYVFAAVVAAAGVVVAFRGLAWGALLVLAGGVLALLTRSAARDGHPAVLSMPRRWVMTDEGLECTSELSSTTYAWRWAGVARVEARPSDYLFVQVGGVSSMSVPRSGLGAAQDAELCAYLERRGLVDRR